MKDRKLREPFEINLAYIIKKYSYNRELEEKVKEKLNDKISEGDVSRIFSGRVSPRLLSDINLLLFSQAFYLCGKGSKEFEKINPYNIFTDNEFNIALHVSLKNVINKNSISFHDVMRDTHKKFGYIYHIANATAEQIVNMTDNNIINYNYESQRESIVKQLFGQDIKIPKIFPEKQDEIAEAILNENYYPVDTIIINVLKTGDEKIEFVPNKDNDNIGTLTLYKVQKGKSTNDIIDGANRQQGIVKAFNIAKEQGEKINAHFKIDVINVSLPNSNDCVRQINKQTPIASERIQALDTSKYTRIVKDINTFDSSETNILYQRIGESLKEYNELNKLTIVPIFSEGLRDHFADILSQQNPIVYRQIMKYQINFFNEFFGNLYDKIKDEEAIQNTKKNTVLLDINMFYCYIYISRKLFDIYKKNNNEWINKIIKIIERINFNKKSKWNQFKTTGKLTKKAKDRILNYLDIQLKNII